MHPDPSKPLTPAQNFQLHGHNIHRLIPPHFRITQRSLIFNALATDTRIKPPPKQRGPPSNPHPCFICRHGPDTISHIFGQCPGVTSARSAFGRRIGITLKSDPKHFGLACRAAPTPQPGNADEIDPSMDAPNPPSHNPLRYTRRTNATIIFNYTVWHSRRTFFKTRHTHTTTDTTHNRLLEQATMYWNRCPLAHHSRPHTPTPPYHRLLLHRQSRKTHPRTKQRGPHIRPRTPCLHPTSPPHRLYRRFSIEKHTRTRSRAWDPQNCQHWTLRLRGPLYFPETPWEKTHRFGLCHQKGHQQYWRTLCHRRSTPYLPPTVRRGGPPRHPLR